MTIANIIPAEFCSHTSHAVILSWRLRIRAVIILLWGVCLLLSLVITIIVGTTEWPPSPLITISLNQQRDNATGITMVIGLPTRPFMGIERSVIIICRMCNYNTKSLDAGIWQRDARNGCSCSCRHSVESENVKILPERGVAAMYLLLLSYIILLFCRALLSRQGHQIWNKILLIIHFFILFIFM